MRKYFFIGAGAFVGAVVRYELESIPLGGHGAFPATTFLINISGSFLLALLLTIAYELWEFDADIRLGLTTGMLGAFTTFSTFCKESVTLMLDGAYMTALSYMFLSIFCGLSAAFLGTLLIRITAARINDGNTEEREGD
jgi:fluoride exporter